MAQFTKLAAAGSTWVLADADGNRVGRIWVLGHIDRILRDGDLAESIAAIMNQTGATRRANARTALATWTTAGGHSVDFSNLAPSLENPPGSGNIDGKRHLFMSGTQLGYLDISEPPSGLHLRLARFARLAEECWNGEQLSTSTLRNQALDGAIDRFRTDGALA